MSKASKILSSLKCEGAESEDQFKSEFNVEAATKNLDELVSKLTKTPVKLELTMGDRKGKAFISVTSNDLAASMRPRMFESLTVTDFGGGVTNDGYYWLPLHFSYQHFGGGSNGTAIATVFLNLDGSIHIHRTDYK